MSEQILALSRKATQGAARRSKAKHGLYGTDKVRQSYLSS